MDTVISCMSAMTFKWGFVSRVEMAAIDTTFIFLSLTGAL